jgi:hypothetical protein
MIDKSEALFKEPFSDLPFPGWVQINLGGETLLKAGRLELVLQR